MAITTVKVSPAIFHPGIPKPPLSPPSPPGSPLHAGQAACRKTAPYPRQANGLSNGKPPGIMAYSHHAHPLHQELGLTKVYSDSPHSRPVHPLQESVSADVHSQPSAVWPSWSPCARPHDSRPRAYSLPCAYALGDPGAVRWAGASLPWGFPTS